MSALNAADTIAAARLIARQHAPYLRTAILSLVMTPKEGLGTMATSADWICYYDPQTVVKWGPDETAAVLCHEVGHCLRNHYQRSKDAGFSDHKRANIAMDAEINDDIFASKKFKCTPGQWILPSMFKLKNGLTFEEYYRAIPPTPQITITLVGGAGNAQDGQGNGPGDKPKPGNGWCGGCAGRPVPGEPEAGGNPAGRSEADQKRIVKEVAIAIRAEVDKQRSQSQGNVPGGWLRWAEEQLLPPKISWEDKLPHLVRHSLNVTNGRQDATYLRPNRRQGGLGYGIGSPILAGWQKPVPRILLAGNTSGSMGSDEMRQIVGTAAELLRTTVASAQLEFVACDAEIHAAKSVKTWREVADNLIGGGGTSFRPVFLYAEAKRKKHEPVDVLIFITDGYGDCPEEPPQHTKVIWLITTGGTPPARWGTVLYLDPDGGAAQERKPQAGDSAEDEAA